jgi:hypothetical protein
LAIHGQSMIIWNTTDLSVGVSPVNRITQYVWKTLMHLGCSTVRKSLSLIVIEDSFHRITYSGMTHCRF